MVENGLKSQLGHRDDDSKELEELRYKRYGAVAKDHQDLNTVMYLHNLLSSERSVVEGYWQRLS